MRVECPELAEGPSEAACGTSKGQIQDQKAGDRNSKFNVSLAVARIAYKVPRAWPGFLLLAGPTVGPRQVSTARTAIGSNGPLANSQTIPQNIGNGHAKQKSRRQRGSPNWKKEICDRGSLYFLALSAMGSFIPGMSWRFDAG